MVKLTNRTKQPRVYNLRHDICCRPGACVCKKIQVHQSAVSPGGVRGFRIVEKSVPDSLSILVGDSAEVDDAVLLLPEIARDIAAGRLSVTRPLAKIEKTPKAPEPVEKPKPSPTALPAVEVYRQGRARRRARG